MVLEIFKTMEEYVESGLVSRRLEEIRHGHVIDHSEMLDALGEYPSRFLGAWWINPWDGEIAIEEVRSVVSKFDLKYLKLHPVWHGFLPEDEIMAPVMEFAAELDVPVWFHCSNGPGTEPEHIAGAAELFPKTKVIMGHAAHVGRAAGEIATRLDNVWLDLSGGMSLMQEVIEGSPGERLLIASDHPYGDLKMQLTGVRTLTEGREDLRRDIIGYNAVRLFKIEGS